MSKFWNSERSPRGLFWRVSPWYATFVVGLGITVDLLAYSVIIPVLPYELEKLGYTNVSGKLGWLVFAFSGGLVISTIPSAMFSEKYQSRWLPLLLGNLILIASQVVFMEVKQYSVMLGARFLQGISSSMIWVPGLALLADQTPQPILGRQLGIAMSGVTIGLLLGPSVAGTLYDRFGYRGPFVFSIVFAFVDLLARLIMLDRKVALKYGYDPKAGSVAESVSSNETSEKKAAEEAKMTALREISLLKVLWIMITSKRTLVASFVTLVIGTAYSAIEPAITLYLYDEYHQSAKKVGLIFLASVVPTLFSGPLLGLLTDKWGPALTVVLSVSLAIPWWIIVTIKKGLPLFIVSFAFESFFTSGTLGPVTAELASIAEKKGIGYAHVYASFNLAYGIGTAIGPVIGGQIYDNLSNGWAVICYISAGLLGLTLVLTVFYSEDVPLAQRFFHGKVVKVDSDVEQPSNLVV